MKDAERIVREAWECVEAGWLLSMPERFCIEMVYDSAMVWAEATQCGLPLTDAEATIQCAWQAALTLTMDRAEEIRMLEEQIQYEETAMYGYTSASSISTGYRAHSRTLGMLQTALADLKRGWKGLPE